ncbi:MAG: hypothetical protein AAAFM81_00840 [Pseudomonadota bacterium]
MKIHIPTTAASTAAPVTGAVRQPNRKVRLFSFGGTGNAAAKPTANTEDSNLALVCFAVAAAEDPKEAEKQDKQFRNDSGKFFSSAKFDEQEVGDFLDHLALIEQRADVDITPDAFETRIANTLSVSPMLVAAARRRLAKMSDSERGKMVKSLVSFACSMTDEEQARKVILYGFNRDRLELANRTPKAERTLDERVRDNADRIEMLENSVASP